MSDYAALTYAYVTSQSTPYFEYPLKFLLYKEVTTTDTAENNTVPHTPSSTVVFTKATSLF